MDNVLCSLLLPHLLAPFAHTYYIFEMIYSILSCINLGSIKRDDLFERSWCGGQGRVNIFRSILMCPSILKNIFWKPTRYRTDTYVCVWILFFRASEQPVYSSGGLAKWLISGGKMALDTRLFVLTTMHLPIWHEASFKDSGILVE